MGVFSMQKQTSSAVPTLSHSSRFLVFPIMLCCALAFGAVSVARGQIINAVIKEVKLTAGQTAEGGIAEYNQVLRLVVDGRAEIAAGQPHGYTWRCLDEKNPCAVKGGLHAR